MAAPTCNCRKAKSGRFMSEKQQIKVNKVREGVKKRVEKQQAVLETQELAQKLIETAKKRLSKFSFSGRRVVELGMLAKGLSKCIGCPKPLELSDCSGETILGLASVLRITCNLCGMVNNIPTCKYRSVGKEAKLPPETK